MRANTCRLNGAFGGVASLCPWPAAAAAAALSASVVSGDSVVADGKMLSLEMCRVTKLFAVLLVAVSLNAGYAVARRSVSGIIHDIIVTVTVIVKCLFLVISIF